MSETKYIDALPEPKRLGLLAQFAGPDELIAAAEKVTDEGYRGVEAYSPFAVIGIDEALKAKGTVLPWIVFCMGLTGCLAGLGLQLYTNALEGPWWLSGYHFQISGKPGPSSIPAFIPVTFELTILLSAFGAFFGMLALNQLPKLFNPLFRANRFADSTTDGFFLFVEASDAKYAEAETSAYLSSIGATGVETVDEVVAGHTVPGVIHMVGACVGTLALLAPLYLWMTSATTTTLPRITLFRDMEAQAKYKAQTTTSLFKDGRAARQPIDGTVSRGSSKDDMQLYYGVDPESNLAGPYNGGDLRFASFSGPGQGPKVPAHLASDDADDAEADDEATEEPAPEEAASEIEEKNWTKEFPESLTVDKEMMKRGEQRFNIYCSACHGLTGAGDGLVTQRAMGLMQGTWVQPTSLHVESVTSQPVGRIFNTITNGIRRMPGYKEQISPQDRWAIILYVKALQRSQNASADDLPKDKLNELSNLK